MPHHGPGPPENGVALIPPGTPEDEAARLAELHAYEVLDTEAEQAFDDLTQLAADILGVPITLVSLVDSDRQWFKSRVGLDAPETPRDISFCGHVVFDDEMLVVPDATEDERFADNPLVVGAPDIRFYAGAPLRSPSGHVLGTLCAIDREPRQLTTSELATMQRLARQVVSQLELRRRQRELARSHAFIAGVLANAPVGIFTTDEAGMVASANRFAIDTLDFDPRKDEPRGIEDFYLEEAMSLPASGEARHARWPALVRDLEHGSEVVRDGALWKGRDGEKLPVHLTVARLEGGGGYLVVLQDERERRRLERQRQELLRQIGRQNLRLERALREARDASAAKTRFCANMSHELRTPMNSILGFTRRLLKRLPGTIPARDLDALETVDRNGRNLLGLINDILDVSTIEAGAFELDRQPTDLIALVQETIADHGSLVAGSSHELSLRLPAEPLEAPVDAKRVRQVLVNLVSNALKYSGGGEVEVSLEVEEDEELGPAVRLGVRDHGDGMGLAEQKMLFQRFSRLENEATRQAEGTGLGLTICAEIAAHHGGRIDLWSEPGQGSLFTLVLPVNPAAAEARRADPESVDSLATGDGPVILCVDDDEEILGLLETSLERAGLRVALATGFEAALALAVEHLPDLICLDVRMPGRDGFEVLEALRQDPLTREIPVLFVTGHDEEEARAAELQVECLSKPFDVEDLVERVQGVLSRDLGEVFVVDDEPDVRRLLEGLFGDRGIAYRSFSSGEAALEVMASTTPGAVVLDLVMPGLDGFQVLETMAASPRLRAVPVVVHTALEMDAEQLLRLREYGSILLRKGDADETTTIGRLLEAVAATKRDRGRS